MLVHPVPLPPTDIVLRLPTFWALVFIVVATATGVWAVTLGSQRPQLESRVERDQRQLAAPPL